MIGTGLVIVGLLCTIFLSRPAAGFVLTGMRTPNALVSPCRGRAMNKGLQPTVAGRMNTIRVLTTEVASTAGNVASATMVFSREDLQRIALVASAQNLEKERIKEEVEMREDENSVMRKLDECVLQCRNAAADARMDHKHIFVLNASSPSFPFHAEREMFVKKRLEKLREVLSRELPLRLPGVEFEVHEYSDARLSENRGFQVTLFWQVV